jgi:DNA-directed RNA polymerase specialized sigma24 family protein
VVNRQEFAGELFDHHAEEVRRYVLGWTLDRSSALDLTTKVLRTAVDRRDQILAGADAADLEMRVFALARAAVTRWRSAPKRGETAPVVPEESMGLFEALGQLDDNQREVLISRELVGLGPDRVGRVLGCDQSVVDDLHRQASETLWRKLDGAPEDASVSTWDRLTVGAALRRAATQWLTPADRTALAVLREQLLGEAPVGVPAKAPQRDAGTAKTTPAPARDQGGDPSGGPAGHGSGGTGAWISGSREPGDQGPRAKPSPAARSSRKSAAAAVKAAAAAAAAKAGGPAAAVLSPPSAPTDASMPLPPSPPTDGDQTKRRVGQPPSGAPAFSPAAAAASAVSAGSAGSAAASAGSARSAAPAAAKPGAPGAGLRGLRGLRQRVLALVGTATRERWMALGTAAVVAAGVGVAAALTMDRAGGTPGCADGSGCLVSTTVVGGAPPLRSDPSGNIPTTTLGGVDPSVGIPDVTAGETTTTTEGRVSTTAHGPDTTVRPSTTVKPPTTLPPTTVKPPTTPTTAPPTSGSTTTSIITP